MFYVGRVHWLSTVPFVLFYTCICVESPQALMMRSLCCPWKETWAEGIITLRAELWPTLPGFSEALNSMLGWRTKDRCDSSQNTQPLSVSFEGVASQVLLVSADTYLSHYTFHSIPAWQCCCSSHTTEQAVLPWPSCWQDHLLCCPTDLCSLNLHRETEVICCSVHFTEHNGCYSIQWI